MTAAGWAVEWLLSHNIQWVSTLCGHGLDPLYHAAKQRGLRLVDSRNEQTAAYLAEAAGRLTRRAAVCAVSSGVAHVNALTGIANAWFDGTPMILITGSGAQQTAGLGHFQDMPHSAVAQPLTRYARTIDSASRVFQILEEACDSAHSAPPGPVQLTFPIDIQNQCVEPQNLILPVPGSGGLITAQEDPPFVAAALAAAQRPLIVAGSGVYYADSGGELLRFAEQNSIPVVIPIWDRGSLPRRSPVFLGVMGAASGGARLLADADCIIMAGAVPDYRAGFLQPGSLRPGVQFLSFQYAWGELYKAYENLGGRSHKAWLDEGRRRRDQFRLQVCDRAREQGKGGIHATDIVATIRHTLTDDATLIVDGGSIGQWMHQLLDDWYPPHWLTCGRSGVVGYGIGAAMGARLARPASPIVLLSGDGAFTFNVADLESAARQKLHFVAIVADDQAWGITRSGHMRQFGEPIASNLGPIDFVKLAESLGARAFRIEKAADLTGALISALVEPAVTVLHVPITGGNPA